MCFGPIPKGEEHYHYKGIYDGDFQDWRAHRECESGSHEYGEYEFMPGDTPMPERVKRLMEGSDRLEDLLKRAMAVLEEYETHRPSCVCRTCDRRRAVLKEWRSRPK